MKKLITSVLAALTLTAGVFTDQLTTETAFYSYLKGTNTKITNDIYLGYAKSIQHETYRKYKDDEFEWEDQFATLKTKFDESIQNTNLDATYTIVTDVEFGDYDFTNEGYNVKINEGTFFPFNSVSVETYPRYLDYSKDVLFCKEIGLSLNDLSKYNFLAMPKAEAKTFLQGRKSSSGYVNRKILIEIEYKLAKFDSAEYKDWAKIASINDCLPLLGIISKINVYDNSNRNNPKLIGELTKK